MAALLLAQFTTYLARIVPACCGRIIRGAAEYTDDRATFQRDAYLAIEKSRSAVFDTRYQPFPSQAELVLTSLNRMRELAAGAGADFAVVLIPDELQVDDELHQEVLALPPGRNQAEFDWERPRKVPR